MKILPIRDPYAVPYTGANANVDLGSHNLITTGIVITNPVRLYYDASNYTDIVVNEDGELLFNQTASISDNIFFTGGMNLGKNLTVEGNATFRGASVHEITITGETITATGGTIGLGDDNLLTTGTLVAGAITGTSLALGGGAITNAGFYPRVLNQADEPAAGTGATQLDTGEMIFWTDTDDSKCYLCYNHGGTVKTVELV